MAAEAHALGVPTRFRIFEYIVEAEGPVDVAELTDFLKLNHNAIRQHLSVLVDAGLIVEQTERRVRVGRPRMLYELNPEVRGSWGTSGPYEELAFLLSEAVRSEQSPRDVARDAGRRRARRLSARSRGLVATMDADLAAGGFRPKQVDASGRVVFILGRCPYVEVAAADPEIICQLHLGLAEGIAQECGEQVAIELIAKNPKRAGCQLSIAAAPEDTRLD